MNTCAATHVGMKRSQNQDYFFTSDYPVGVLPNLYIVADGMGGHNAGEVASSFCVNHLVNLLRATSGRTPIQAIEAAVKQTNEELIYKARNNQEYTGMGTTMVLCSIMNDGTALIANIGDSRLYQIGEEIRQITEDHSMVAEMVRSGKLSKEAARFHPKKNVISRALTTDMVVSPDFYQISVQKGEYLLLCSDGLTDMVEENEMARIIRTSTSIGKAADTLVANANENGGKDNITLVLIQI